MQLIGLDVLRAAGKKDKPLRTVLELWAATVIDAEWSNIDDVRKTYPSADGVTLGSGTVITIFNIKGNNYRLLSWIDYDSMYVEALEVITHAEYDKNFWKARY